MRLFLGYLGHHFGAIASEGGLLAGETPGNLSEKLGMLLALERHLVVGSFRAVANLRRKLVEDGGGQIASKILTAVTGP